MGIHLLKFGEGVALAAHLFSRPAIYLDHWALDTFASNDDLGDALVGHVRRTGGVLCVSDTNMAEVCRATDRRHAETIDRLIYKALPDVYCIDLATLLLDQEYGPLQPTAAPPANDKMARALLEQHALGLPGLFQHVWDHQRVEVTDQFNVSCAEVAGILRRQRDSASFVRRAKTAPVDRETPRTRLIMGELLRPMMLNQRERIEPNDAADFQHAMTALVYCDYALLDGKWADRARSASHRLRRQGLMLARCYSGRRNDVMAFLNALGTLPNHVALTDRKAPW